MSWDKGRDVVEDLLSRGHLEQVPGNEAEAQHLLDKARAHLHTARAAKEIVDAVKRILPEMTVFVPRR